MAAVGKLGRLPEVWDFSRHFAVVEDGLCHVVYRREEDIALGWHPGDARGICHYLDLEACASTPSLASDSPGQRNLGRDDEWG